MPDPNEPSEPGNALSFLGKPQISFSEGDDRVYDVRVQSNFQHFNDSNSDDTQFEIQGGDLNSHDTSPIKDNVVPEQIRHQEDPEPTNKYVEHDLVASVEEVTETALQPKKPTILNNTDATSFVDYFLAHDDLLQALDEYSRSVGQTSVFSLEMAPTLSACDEKYCNSKNPSSPSAGLQRSDISQENRITPNDKRCQKKEGNNALPPKANREKGTASSKQVRGDGHLTSQPGAETLQRRSEKRKPRTYSQAIPSQHCHICSRRPTETSPHAVCGNLLKGRCRKTICTKCFHQFRWDLKAAREAPPGTWECPHCRGECPQRAQCVIYNRTSDRRRMKLINHRKKKDQTKVSALRKHELTSKMAGKTESRADSPESGTTTMNRFVTPSSCSASQTAGRPTNASNSEKPSLQSSGISKPMKTAGISTYGQLVMGDEICQNFLSGGKLLNDWEGTGIISTAEMTGLEIAPKVTGLEQEYQLELKSDVEVLRDNSLNADGDNGSEDMTGVFGCMGIPTDVLNVASEKETGMGMVVGKGNEEVNSSLGLLDIQESFERGKRGGESDHECLKMWDGDEVKLEEMETEEFTFNEAGLDFDTIA